MWAQQPDGRAPLATVDIRVEQVDVLRRYIRDAFLAGRAYAAAKLSPAHGALWLRARLAKLAEEAPSIFGSRGQYRTAGLATLRYALDRGHDDYQVRPMTEPTDEKLERLADEVVSSFFVACLYERPGDVDENDILNPPEIRAEPFYSVITDDGIHRIRSDFFEDEDGRLYQLIVVRDGNEVTVLRRYCGATDVIPVSGGFTETEMNFLALAFAEIRAARGRPSDLP